MSLKLTVPTSLNMSVSGLQDTLLAIRPMQTCAFVVGFPRRVAAPKTFNEKLQWLKIHDRNKQFVQLADKYAVGDFVEARIDRAFINNLLGVYHAATDIDWESVPDSFVHKATHGSGIIILVECKATLNRRMVNVQLKRWLATDYSRKGQELVYHDIPRKIIAESLLHDAAGQIQQDYKVLVLAESRNTFRLTWIDLASTGALFSILLEKANLSRFGTKRLKVSCQRP